VAAVVLAALALGRPGFDAPAASAALPAPEVATSPRPVTFAAVGDSITNANSPDFAGLRVGDRSWVHYAAGPGLTFVGGWARGGAQSADMARAALPVDADVLVIIAGTNDLAHAVTFEATCLNLVAIARAVGAPRVVVSAIPPRDSAPGAAVEFNRRLETFAASQGWTFVDAMGGIRDADRYAPGMTDDGLHPSLRAAKRIGAALAAAIAG